MIKEDVENMVRKCTEEAVFYFKQGNLKEGRKWENRASYFKKLLKDYE